MCKKVCSDCYCSDFFNFFMLVIVLPAEVLNLPPGLGDDLGLVGVHRHAHQALQRPVTPRLHPVNKKSFLYIFFQYLIQQCFICRPSDPLCRRGCWDRTQEQLRLRHWLSDALTTRLGIPWEEITDKFDKFLGHHRVFYLRGGPWRNQNTWGNYTTRNLRITATSPFTVAQML